MKPILITGITPLNARLAGEFIKQHCLFSASVVLTPAGFTESVAEMCKYYSLNVLLNLDGTDEMFNSIEEATKRDSGFLERINSYPSNKMAFLYVCDKGEDPAGVLSLALSFPNVPLRMVRSDDVNDSFFQLRENIFSYQVATGDHLENIDFAYTLNQRYDVLNFGTIGQLLVQHSTENIDVKLI